MFAYCRNNPVIRSDDTGTNPLERILDDDNTTPWNDYENISRCPGGSGGSTWGAFLRTLRGAAHGLTMPMNRTNMARMENHHILSNKNSTYTPQFTKIVYDKYGIPLNDPANIVSLPGHKGRHTNAYHDIMLWSLEELDFIANGNVDIFLEGFGIMREFLKENAWLPYGK